MEDEYEIFDYDEEEKMAQEIMKKENKSESKSKMGIKQKIEIAAFGIVLIMCTVNMLFCVKIYNNQKNYTDNQKVVVLTNNEKGESGEGYYIAEQGTFEGEDIDDYYVNPVPAGTTAAEQNGNANNDGAEKEEKTQISFRLPEELYANLFRAANRSGQSTAKIVRRLLESAPKLGVRPAGSPAARKKVAAGKKAVAAPAKKSARIVPAKKKSVPQKKKNAVPAARGRSRK